MKKKERDALLTLPVILLAGGMLAVAGSRGGAAVAGVPLFALCVALAFVIQWLAFVPAYRWQTERFYDLTGSITYVSVTGLAVVLSPAAGARALLLAALVVVWSVRLGAFLFRRIRKAGKDERFDALKPSLVRFLQVWTLQGLWVSFTAGAAWAAITSTVREGLGWPAALGALIWMAGFAMEVVADEQKRRFRADPANEGDFIKSGLWAWSRHPNYFGEIVLWIGVAVVALPVLQGWQLVTLVSPVFVALLLTRISGIPLLEKRADERWGERADYRAYKARTPVLVPRPPGSSAG